jgi:nucleoside-diphosphate kinase
MAMERTLSIIKPDAVHDNVIGKIEAQIEAAGLSIVAVKMTRLSKNEGEDAIKKYRKVMGATMFGEAEPGTIRANFATSNAHNAVHGSDSVENAQREIGFFFPERQIYGRKENMVKKKLESVA